MAKTDDTSLKHLLDADRAVHGSWRKRFFIFLAISLVFLAWFVPFIPALYLGTITVKRLDAKGKLIDSEVGPSTPQWISINKVSRHIINAVIVAEDGKFYHHHGFDFEAISKAIDLNRRRGKYVRGASTISQQVVKMAFLSREKTIIRKLREAAGTVVLELVVPKDKILEWYINLCEFGGGIYGVKPAGRFYFKTRPELLTIEQAVHLAVVIPSPNKWSKGLRSGSLTPFGQRRFARIVNNMYLAGFINENQKKTALARGNFGNPIAGYGTLEDDDDCRGDRECEEGALDPLPQTHPSTATQMDPDLATGAPLTQPAAESAPSLKLEGLPALGKSPNLESSGSTPATIDEEQKAE
jgi:monofunctional biosynthetic peptidoglycan transglycosylase